MTPHPEVFIGVMFIANGNLYIAITVLVPDGHKPLRCFITGVFAFDNLAIGFGKGRRKEVFDFTPVWFPNFSKNRTEPR
ncbi:MAG: hypothetical protein A2934_05340 [Candidatus Sungbacteria bacterium RIFCSPLOWO2_01_FULL_47_10]|uniref:Uncharacterized protein n=1 Tax=Candidatus Sungbacteria bacterium RIFCSPLOWO2_01_FULL_47_10 TaxID=1802276 RepID=A0A1G2L436_9BACT|nr:MAG: hypothetical protein A2934_05340 [Candidatus Sungbacteria bacterium RIFCSPLOWO2_01_FULL_47_10]